MIGEAEKKQPQSELEPATVLEPHYTLAQIAEAWSISSQTVHRYFAEEPGVLKLGHPTRLKGRKYQRRYYSLRVPRSVYLRVWSRLSPGEPAVSIRGCEEPVRAHRQHAS